MSLAKALTAIVVCLLFSQLFSQATFAQSRYTSHRHSSGYSISGSISPAPSGSLGYTVTLTPNNVAVTSDSSGSFVFSNVAPGTYTITPSLSGDTFSPSSRSVTVYSSSVSGVNFADSSSSSGSSPNVVFYDDFSASTLTANWYAINEPGDASNNELQCYTPSQDQLSGGYLVIHTILQAVTCGPSATRSSYNSGLVTWSSYNFTYGTIEFRAKMAGGQGAWPAIWLLGYYCQPANAYWSATKGSCNWPSPGSDEIDITEILNSNHGAVNQGIHSNGHNDACTATTSDVSQNFHVYDLVWTQGQLTWKIDGNTTCTIRASYVPRTPMFLIINTAVGGAGGSVNNSTLPQSTQVDYVKVTQP